VVRSPLHGVDWCEGCVESCSIFLFRLEIDETIFGVMVGCATMVHAVQRFECVRSSVMASVMAQSSASLAALGGSLVEISLMPFLWRCSNFFPYFLVAHSIRN
jgi:hypothetical protein